jgi:hypothetical protein
MYRQGSNLHVGVAADGGVHTRHRTKYSYGYTHTTVWSITRTRLEGCISHISASLSSSAPSAKPFSLL